MENLNIKTYFADKEGQIVSIELEGYIDQTNCEELEKLFRELKESGSYKLIFDFHNLQYVSSAGWGVFVGEVKEIRDKGGDIKIVNMNPEVYEIFQMLEFYHILDEYLSMEEAINSFRSDRPKSESIEISQLEAKNSEIMGETLKESNHKNNDQEVKEQGKVIEIFEIGESSPDSVLESSSPDSMDSLSLFRIESHDDKYEDENQYTVDISRLPIQEKIKQIVAQFPLLTIRQIKKMLSHGDFGKERVGFFKLYRLLRSLNLETKAKRYRYWRSC